MPLNKDTPTSTYIDDFVHSKNKKFKGKSKAERIKMALGASYAKKNEEEEPKIRFITFKEGFRTHQVFGTTKGNKTPGKEIELKLIKNTGKLGKPIANDNIKPEK